ncbi:MAG TPA: rod shape-determining protein RodA [Firmicutes bacterium]|jgi:rod shape determining protein RodA|nr:rod shape-determining protein RodA [Bacillota bacterium]HBG45082.1 rod shape-determining protein RodA [Bacillota bacterium]HBL49746.1 rod shape-determining protein RodA [Bacillota bacterium]HBL67921.1 rod shape-determining protein RodA [Bacillota bacterium]
MRVDRRLLKNLDWALIAITLILIATGVVIVYSATRANPALTGGNPFAYARKQIIAAIIGIAMVIGLMTFDYHLSERGYYALYFLNLLLLIAVLLFGKEVNGAKSWFHIGPLGIQPSEFAKIFLILTLARHLSQKDSLSSFFDLISAFVHIGVPLLLILLQPDLGTAMVLVAILFGMLYLAGARPKHLGVIVLSVVAIVVVWALLSAFFGVPFPLKSYQIARLTAFVNPQKYYDGAGYNVIQSMTAVGSGRFLGKGLFNSTQGRLGFLPEHHTDFIFAIFGEEFGFLGCFLLLLGYLLLIWRGLKIAYQAKDLYGSLIAGGVVSMFLFHVLVNVGMNIGIMPITGIPLPFISAGGSSMMVNLVGVGLLLNVWSRRLKIMF